MENHTFSIYDGGRSAEDRFLILTGATKSSKSSLGDAVLESNYIEVKRATSKTLNQVRAVKYITLVAFHEPTSSWYVVPAHCVVIMVSKKSRGQHTENPFESSTLSISKLGRFRVTDESTLRHRVLEAVADSDMYHELRAEMFRVLSRSKELAAESIVSVRKSMASFGLSQDVTDD